MSAHISPPVRSRSVLRRAACSAVEALEKRQVFASGLSTVVDAGGNLTVDNALAPTHSLYKGGRALTKPSTADDGAIAVAYLKSHAADFGLLAGDVANPIITNQYADADTGISHVYLRQSLNGLPILNADMNITLMPDGSVVSAAGSFLPNLAHLSRGVKGPRVNAGGALVNAADQLSLDDKGTAYKTRSASKTGVFKTVLTAPTVAQGDIEAQLRYVLAENGLKMVWNFALHTTDNQHWYNVAVGGNASEVVYADDWVDEASYNVIPRPNESPQDGGFAVLTDPQDPTASPFGWHDTNGVAGAEFTDTRGNNVDAHLDRVADNVADGVRPDGGAALNFSGFTFDAAGAPTTLQNQNIAQVNLFYANNLLHDIHYKYGFTEAAGNFQTNNYGRGGTGNDAVQADGQDGGGTNNANFGTPPEGQAPRMQMFLFNQTTPNRDGDLDLNVMIHEYGHGVSNRLTGGPANASALTATQSGGMGEGWGDFWALMFLQRSTDTQNASYGMGTYVLGQPQTGGGIRRYPYSYNMALDPLTIDGYGTSGSGGGVTRSTEVHNSGEIWATTLWDMNWLLINKYGFEPNIQNGLDAANVKGNTLALKIVMDALKIQPVNPSFKDARDAIIQADINLHNTLGTPLNTTEIWTAFARRGMGALFVDTGATATSVTPSFVVPQADPYIVSVSPTTTAYAPFTTIDLSFDQAMNTSSFSVAGDVLSFTGPGGVNVASSITGFTWTNSTTLRLNLGAMPTGTGTYTLTVGPNLLAADDGHAMDNNHNNVPGEAGDGYTATFNLVSTVGPDTFGYSTASYPYENLNLAIGDAGVVTVQNASNDASTALNLGANTFNFYGTSYTGAASLFAGVNGMVSFGSSNTDWTNNPLTTATNVSQAAILPAWDDWRTDTNGAGATDSALLYKLDTANNRLIIEWSDVTSYFGSGVATFQAILQLNTGAVPGRIIYNYPDYDITGTGTNGGTSTIGIKNTGAPAATRLQLSHKATHPWINSGTAVLTALDVVGPKVTNEVFNFQNDQSFTVTFSEDVGATLGLADFTLVNTTTGTTVPAANLGYAYNAATRTATITRTGPRLLDGKYSLTINANGVTDGVGNFLDGNGDNAIGGDHVFKTFVLYGDIDRDGGVSINDFNTFALSFGKPIGQTWLTGDFDNDGGVSINDFNLLAGNFGRIL